MTDDEQRFLDDVRAATCCANRMTRILDDAALSFEDERYVVRASLYTFGIATTNWVGYGQSPFQAFKSVTQQIRQFMYGDDLTSSESPLEKLDELLKGLGDEPTNGGASN